MADKNIQKIWKEALESESPLTGKIKILKDLDGAVKTVEGQIKIRDRIEIIVAILIIPFFVFALFRDISLWSKAGALILICYCLLVIYMLKNVKKYKKAFDPLCTIKDQLVNMKDYLTKEKDLLDNVLYWYLLPPFIGASLFFIGRNPGFVVSITYMTFIALLYWYIYRLNKKAVKNKFIPLINELDVAIKDLDTPNDI